MKLAAVPAAVSSTCTNSSLFASAVSCTSGASVHTASSSNASTATSTEHVEEASQSYIMKVQHLIERCLTLYLDREECVEALFQHAGIDPIITRTVWKELEKENQEFFERYNNSERVARKQPDITRDDEGQSSRMLLIQGNLSDKARF
ncbi:hypothetical protein L7F22_065195 [Adiantum nelumboides]|nr:hypothetical protein [Adiantum nelumboides]